MKQYSALSCSLNGQPSKMEAKCTSSGEKQVQVHAPQATTSDDTYWDVAALRSVLWFEVTIEDDFGCALKDLSNSVFAPCLRSTVFGSFLSKKIE